VFMDRYPDIEIDLCVTNSIVDIVDGGYDAGIRYGGTVPEDMIAQRLSAEIRWVAAGSPAYFDRFGMPEHPRDLMHHRCSQIRLGDDRIYRWEFDREEESASIAVPGAITIDDSETAKALALNGATIMYAPEPSIAAEVARGELRVILPDWASMGPAWHIYYPGRRQVPVGLRLLVDLIRELRPLGY
jgi:DNA-binding transcriptional LysR family regulator